MKRQTDRIVLSSCWEQLRTGKVWQRLSLALLVAVMTMTAQTARAGEPPTNIVTQDNFYDFFDDEGNLLDDVTFDELVFQGEFSNSNNELVPCITIDRALTITGDNAVLNNIALHITGEDVTLDNVSVTYDAPDGVEAKAIFADGADNFALINSEIIFTGATPGTEHYRGLEVRDCDAAIIDNNTITATFPAVAVNYLYGEPGIIDLDLVLAVGIQDVNNVEFTNNRVTVNTNGGIDYPTIDAVMISSAKDILIKGNSIRLVDNTTEESPRYYYGLDIYNTTGTVEANTIIVNTTTATDDVREGTAYSIQVTSSTVTINNNELTAVSKGPTCAIYVSNWYGPADLTVTDNNIDVTGYFTTTTSNNYDLVAGIEAGIEVFKAYNNTITVANGAVYNDANKVYGVSMTNLYISEDPSADIKDNTIIVDGQYAVYYAKAVNANVTGNALCAHELTGDAAVNIASGSGNTVDNNHGLLLAAKEVTVDGQTDYWTTFYCGGVGLTFDEATNACAYTATYEVVNEVVTITLHKLGQVIPKGTAVIIVSEDEDIKLKSSTDEAENTVGNDLHGMDMATALSDVKKSLDADAILVLSNKGGNFGFHELATTNVPARKAFLAINAPDPSRQFTMVFEDATGIEDIDHSPLTIEHSVYDLQGRKVANPGKGLYIVNGRKVIIK